MSHFTISAGTQIYYLPLEFELEHGGTLIGCQVAYELQGPADAPLVLALGGISAGRHVTASPEDPTPGWWESVVGSGRAIDTDSFRVLSIDFIGGSGATTGPSNWQGEGRFPLVSSRDQARAIALLLEHIGVRRVHRFIGSSFGGMVGLAFAAEFGDRLGGLIAIGAAHESHPMAVGWRSLQRRIVLLGKSLGDERAAVSLARGLAMTTYRSHQEFGERFDSKPSHVNGVVRFPVEDYLLARGEEFSEHYTADEFLALSQAIDLHNIDPAEIVVPTLLIGFNSDLLVPITQLRDLAAGIGDHARLIELPSLYGHDGFLKEVETLRPILNRALLGEVRS